MEFLITVLIERRVQTDIIIYQIAFSYKLGFPYIVDPEQMIRDFEDIITNNTITVITINITLRMFINIFFIRYLP